MSIAGTARFDEDEHGACPQATVARQHHELLRSVAHEEASAPAARRAGLRDCRFPCLKSLLCVVSPRRLQSEPRCSGETPQTHQRPAGTPWDPPARSFTGEYPPATQGSPHQPSGISGHNHGDGAMQRAPDPARRPRHAAGDGLERLWRARHEGHQAVRSQPRAGRWQQGLPVGPLLMQGHGGVSVPTHPTATKITFSSTVTLSQSPRWCIHLGGWPDLPGSVGLSLVPHSGVGPWFSP